MVVVSIFGVLFDSNNGTGFLSSGFVGHVCLHLGLDFLDELVFVVVQECHLAFGILAAYIVQSIQRID